MKSKPTTIFVPPLKSTSQGGTTVRISSRQTEGAYCACEMTTLPGEGVPLHVHDRDEEFYFRDPDDHSLEYIALLDAPPDPDFTGPLSAWQKRSLVSPARP